jgi:serine phosphatase RsbU (regulator of sigma subunit)
MCTDGLLDAEDSHGEPFGDERFGQVLDAANHVSVATLKHDVLDHLFEHRGNRPPEDDVTVLVAEVL